MKNEYLKKLEEKSNEHREEINKLKNQEDPDEEKSNLISDLVQKHEEMARQINEFKLYEHATKDEIERDFNNIYGLINKALESTAE